MYLHVNGYIYASIGFTSPSLLLFFELVSSSKVLTSKRQLTGTINCSQLTSQIVSMCFVCVFKKKTNYLH